MFCSFTDIPKFNFIFLLLSLVAEGTEAEVTSDAASFLATYIMLFPSATNYVDNLIKKYPLPEDPEREQLSSNELPMFTANYMEQINAMHYCDVYKADEGLKKCKEENPQLYTKFRTFLSDRYGERMDSR